MSELTREMTEKEKLTLMINKFSDCGTITTSYTWQKEVVLRSLKLELARCSDDL